MVSESAASAESLKERLESSNNSFPPCCPRKGVRQEAPASTKVSPRGSDGDFVSLAFRPLASSLPKKIQDSSWPLVQVMWNPLDSVNEIGATVAQSPREAKLNPDAHPLMGVKVYVRSFDNCGGLCGWMFSATRRQTSVHAGIH